jgi:Leucine-rich repeat (LRR) protein
MSSICPQLIALYQVWKDNLSLMRKARLRYQDSGSEADSIAFDEARDLVRQARLEYRKAAYETMVEYRNNEICQLESMIVERMDLITQEDGGDASLILVKHGRVRTLDFSNNLFPSIDQAVRLSTHFSKLSELSCSNTQLKELPELPKSLTWLNCSNTQIKKLPELPNSLTNLRCYNTKVFELPTLPDSLVHLFCYGTDLKNLPTLPDSLTWLNCSHTPLTKLPELPNFLTRLDCSSTQLKELPKLPDSLTNLRCSNIQLTNLPELPDSLTYIDIRSTPAAQDPAIQARLEAFKQAHPNAIVTY